MRFGDTIASCLLVVPTITAPFQMEHGRPILPCSVHHSDWGHSLDCCCPMQSHAICTRQGLLNRRTLATGFPVEQGHREYNTLAESVLSTPKNSGIVQAILEYDRARGICALVFSFLAAIPFGHRLGVLPHPICVRTLLNTGVLLFCGNSQRKSIYFGIMNSFNLREMRSGRVKRIIKRMSQLNYLCSYECKPRR